MKVDSLRPLDVLNLRRMDYCPPWFEDICLPIHYNLEQAIINWIESNLKGRFYIDTTIGITHGKTSQILRIGFEDSKELSFFTLACPHLKYK